MSDFVVILRKHRGAHPAFAAMEEGRPTTSLDQPVAMPEEQARQLAGQLNVHHPHEGPWSVMPAEEFRAQVRP